jgi:hypothetical protein
MLPQILNSAFPIKLGETELMVKMSSIEDAGAFSELLKKLQDNKVEGANITLKLTIFAIRLCAQKAYEEPEKSQITDEYIKSLMPLYMVSECNNILQQLGFIQPKTDITKVEMPLGNK